MFPYILLICYVMIVSAIYKYHLINDKIYLFLILIALVLLQGSRSIYVGRDTMFYETAFFDSRSISFTTIFHSFPRMFIAGHYQSVETGYILVNKIISLFTNNSQIMLYIISLLSCLGFFIFIYNNSIDIYWSIMLFICEGIYMNSFNMMRQMFAISICINAYTLILKRHYVWASILIILSAQIHASSWLFVPILILYILIKKCSPKYKKFFVILPLFMPIGVKIMGILYPQYAGYTKGYLYEVSIGKITFLWLLLIIIGLIGFRYLKKNSKYIFFFTSYISYVVLQFMSISATGTARISYWFEAFGFLLIPIAFRAMKRQYWLQLVLKTGLIILLVGLYISFANSLLIDSMVPFMQ